MTTTPEVKAAVERSALSEALGLFPSVIRCGEPWTATCQSVLDRAHAELTALKERANERDEAMKLVATKGAQIAKPPAFPVKAKRPTGVVP